MANESEITELLVRLFHIGPMLKESGVASTKSGVNQLL